MLIAAYAVCGSVWLASSTETFCHADNCGGVMLLQCAPPSVVSQISPSSVPAQMRLTSTGDGAQRVNHAALLRLRCRLGAENADGRRNVPGLCASGRG